MSLTIGEVFAVFGGAFLTVALIAWSFWRVMLWVESGRHGGVPPPPDHWSDTRWYPPAKTDPPPVPCAPPKPEPPAIVIMRDDQTKPRYSRWKLCKKCKGKGYVPGPIPTGRPPTF